MSSLTHYSERRKPRIKEIKILKISEVENKAIQVICFDGKKKNYKTWAKKFLLAKTLRGYNIVLTEKDPKVPKQELVL